MRKSRVIVFINFHMVLHFLTKLCVNATPSISRTICAFQCQSSADLFPLFIRSTVFGKQPNNHPIFLPRYIHSNSFGDLIRSQRPKLSIINMDFTSSSSFEDSNVKDMEGVENHVYTQVQAPALPAAKKTEFSERVLCNSQVDQISKYFEETLQENEEIRKVGQQISRNSNAALHLLQSGRINEAAIKIQDGLALLSEIREKIAGSGPRVLRVEQISSDMERLSTAVIFQHFLNTGALASTSAFPENLFTDSEYLSGAMGLCQEIQKYAVGRATVQDLKSVEACSMLVDAIFGKLLEFDFRNGPLRKKYDSVKYQVRRLQDITYELSLVGVRTEGQAKRLKTDQEPKKGLFENENEIDEIRSRMEEYDATREKVIKDTRDVQKLSKNSIYSLHRGDFRKAEKQLSQALNLAKEIEPIIIEEPTLRFGSYSNAMEEYAEAKLYQSWLQEKQLITIEQLEIVNTVEYLGGLMDMTGELGRYAVARATQRDTEGVQACRDTDLRILEMLLQISLPAKLYKKMDMVHSSARKLDNVLYELSLVKAGKGTVAPPSSVDESAEKNPEDTKRSGSDL
mmetsp:Transcript_31716/g.40686  ORF Transcript_31716/g.40686 Transcript_31716/m.40686 type:complete len:570 (+) Transcript_31716:32-1741(+)